MNTMKRAHQIKKEAAEKWNCTTSEIIFSLCLKVAWTEIKGEKEMTVEEKAIARINLMAKTQALREAEENNELTGELEVLIQDGDYDKVDEMVETSEIEKYDGYKETIEKYDGLIRREIKRHTEMAKMVGFEMFAK